MKGFVDDIEGLTEKNKDFRRVLYTGRHVQLVVMSIRKGDETPSLSNDQPKKSGAIARATPPYVCCIPM